MNPLPAVLLAEDDENDIFFLQRAFKAAGIENPFHVVRDGQDAIDYLSGQGSFSDRTKYPLPALLILDLKMPRKTGMDLLQWKHQQPILKSLPSIVLSSSAHRHDIERAYRFGANGFVVKPQSVDTRTALARFIKGFWLEFNQPPIACIEGVEEAMKLYAAMEIPSSFF